MHFSLLILVGGVLACTAKIPANYEQVPGHGLYRYSQTKKAWDAAKAECESEGATLAVFNSPTEAAAVKEMFFGRRTLELGIFAHVGFQDQESDGVYKTVNVASFDCWGSKVWKYPRTGSTSNHSNYCGGMMICGRATDMRCEDPAPFICEYPTVGASAESPEVEV